MHLGEPQGGLTNGPLLYFGQCLASMAGQIPDEHIVLLVLLEELPQDARLFPVLVGDLG